MNIDYWSIECQVSDRSRLDTFAGYMPTAAVELGILRSDHFTPE